MSTCAFNEHGYACTCEGVISYATNGGGHWYCREHADVIRGVEPTAVGNRLTQATSSRVVEERARDWRWDDGQRRYVPRTKEEA